MSVITLALAKEHLDVSHTAKDNVIQEYIDGAEEWVERYCGVKLAAAAFTDDLDGGQLYLWPRNQPVNSITSIVDLRSPTATELDKILIDGRRIARANSDGDLLAGVRWGEGRGRWRVTYNGGYSSVPAELRAVILDLVYRRYWNRGGQAGGSAAGASTSWAALATEFKGRLKPYMRTRPVSG